MHACGAYMLRSLNCDHGDELITQSSNLFPAWGFVLQSLTITRTYMLLDSAALMASSCIRISETPRLSEAAWR